MVYNRMILYIKWVKQIDNNQMLLQKLVLIYLIN